MEGLSRSRRANRERLAAIEPRPPIRPDIVYRISGDSPPSLARYVASDGVKTYIEFPAETFHGDLPALLSLAEENSFLGLASLFSGPEPQLVNYRFVNNRFEADKVLDRAELISGVGGDQVKVSIT